MAVTYIPTKGGQGYVVLCLAADVKPTSTTPASLIETDTGILYYPNGGGGWTAVSGGGITHLTGDVTAGPGTGSQAATLASVVSASTNTKITYDAKGRVTAGAAATLASSDFANQGTATTVLHGNASGNPAFGAVVEADITLAANTTNNVSTSKHGFTPVLPNDATKYLDGTGAYTVPAGSGGGAWTQISRQVLGSDVATVTFSSISGSYNHLKLFVTGRDTNGTDPATRFFVQFNADTGATYDWIFIWAYGLTDAALVADANAQTKGLVGLLPGPGSSRAASRGQAELFIPDYATTTFEKTCVGTTGTAGIITNDYYAGTTFTNWRNTAAITQIVLLAGDKFKTGSIFTLYGIT